MDIRQDFRISTIQLTDNMKPNIKEGQSINASIPLRKVNKVIKGCSRRNGPRWEMGRGGIKQAGSGIGRNKKEVQRSRKMNSVGWGNTWNY